MYTVLKRSCWAIVLLMNSFVFPRLRCRRRRRRALLKVPIMYVENLEQNKKKAGRLKPSLKSRSRI